MCKLNSKNITIVSDDGEVNKKKSQFTHEKREQLKHYMNMDLENLSVEQLEAVILRLYYNYELTKDVKVKLDEALCERMYKINKTFEWTPKNKEKFLRLNQKLIECWEKLDVEAKQTLKTLNSRLSEQDCFLQDFELEAVVRSFIYVTDENGEFCEAENCIEEVLIDTLDDNYSVNYTSYLSCDEDDLPLYLDREQNCSTEPRFDGKFNEHFISQAIHDLYDHTCLSFPDILKINRLWAELRITNQHFVEV